MGHLSKPQLMVLALWSYGIVLAKSCGLTSVALVLANSFAGKESNFRQRLREWCWDRQDKQGKKRVDWDVSQSFVPLLKWIMALWTPEERKLVLAMDASSLKQRFVVLSLSVVYRGCAIPIGWVILPEGKPGAWKEHWLKLFECFEASTPADWVVIVAADRGLYARWLFDAIQKCGWHPFLRINLRCHYRMKGTAEFRPMAQLLQSPNQVWSGAVTCFVKNSVDGTLLACWGIQHLEPWFILTDLPPENASAAWYAMRSWIEDAFKDIKSDGWQWQNTRMNNPTRAARLWLALAVASLWVISLGGLADLSLPDPVLTNLPLNHIARRTKKHQSKHRIHSCFAQGIIKIITALINQLSIAPHTFIPEPWPENTYP